MLEFRAIVPGAGEFRAGRLSDSADSRRLEKEFPLGQVAAISGSRLARVRVEDDAPERMPESVHEY